MKNSETISVGQSRPSSAATALALWSAPTCWRFSAWRGTPQTAVTNRSAESGDKSPHSRVRLLTLLLLALCWLLPAPGFCDDNPPPPPPLDPAGGGNDTPYDGFCTPPLGTPPAVTGAPPPPPPCLSEGNCPS